MNAVWENDTIRLTLEGRIDSGNSADVESEIIEAIGDRTPGSVALDAERLEYISSAGLRIILRLRKDRKSVV